MSSVAFCLQGFNTLLGISLIKAVRLPQTDNNALARASLISAGIPHWVGDDHHTVVPTTERKFFCY